jgi:hypothetical protein
MEKGSAREYIPLHEGNAPVPLFLQLFATTYLVRSTNLISNLAYFEDKSEQSDTLLLNPLLESILRSHHLPLYNSGMLVPKKRLGNFF